VSLLLSEPEQTESPDAFLMPSLAGLTLAGAATRAYAAGLRIVSAEDLNTPTPAADAPQASTTAPAGPSAIATPAAPSAPATPLPNAFGTVIAQTPPAGHRVVKGDPVHISLANESASQASHGPTRIGGIMEHNLEQTMALLGRTHAALDALLRGLPETCTG